MFNSPFSLIRLQYGPKMSVYTTGRYLQTSYCYLILFLVFFASWSFLFFCSTNSYIFLSAVPPLNTLYIVFLLVYCSPLRFKDADHGIMAAIQRCDSGKLAFRFHRIWRSSSAISDCMPVAPSIIIKSGFLE